ACYCWRPTPTPIRPPPLLDPVVPLVPEQGSGYQAGASPRTPLLRARRGYGHGVPVPPPGPRAGDGRGCGGGGEPRRRLRARFGRGRGRWRVGEGEGGHRGAPAVRAAAGGARRLPARRHPRRPAPPHRRADRRSSCEQLCFLNHKRLTSAIETKVLLPLLQTHYVLLLCSFKEQLQQHVRVHAMEAVMACWELEQTLQSLTGASPGEGTGATMSDDEDNPVDSESNMFDGNDVSDGMGFGMLTEGERSLVERVRQELKHELKQGYREKLVDIREEILRKRRAGKLPGDTASTLKAWWQAHAKWPYPTEEDKARLVQETGLQLKQINNWFINQRKRNWHSNPTSSSSDKSKRKRNNAGDGNA
uniref:Homeobox domain-containing protein n=1 Tax=Aegilops tauschii subsp. strangulata TaxID=200361 RepID=A0A453T5S0_AEGTS